MASQSRQQPMRPARPNHEKSKTNGNTNELNDYTTQFSDERTTSQNSSNIQKDTILSQFMKATGLQDEAFTLDILNETQWNLNDAIKAFQSLQIASNPPPYNPTAYDNISQQSRPNDSVDSGRTNQHRHKLKRGFSTAIDNVDHNDSLLYDFSTSFMIPDLSTLSDKSLADYIEQDLIDFVTLNLLERTDYINWWALKCSSMRLWPLSTEGDGNCLLHAASLAMWGREDKSLYLRGLLHKRLQIEDTNGALYRRWRWQQTQSNKESSLVFSESEWQAEWQALVRLSSVEKKPGADNSESRGSVFLFEFLEEFHVFVLAQILCRPIIVFADSILRDVDGNPLSPQPFGGIYLPLLQEPQKCCKSPILLAYEQSHFTAVVTMEKSKSSKNISPLEGMVPLTGRHCDLLPTHYFVDPGENVNWNYLPEDQCGSLTDLLHLLKKYLDVKSIVLDQSETCYSDSNFSSQETLQATDSDKKSKALKIFKTKDKEEKVKKQKTSNIQSTNDTEFEPDTDTVLCASLNIKTPVNYQRYVKEYLKFSKEEYLKKRDQGKLKDTSKIPSIAKKLSVDVNQRYGGHVSSGISPSQQGCSLCKQCGLYQGTADCNGLCSLCYKRTDSLKKCCGCETCSVDLNHNGYCLICVEKFINRMDEQNNERAKPAIKNGYEIPIQISPESSMVEHSLRPSQHSINIHPNPQQSYSSSSSKFPVETRVVGNSTLLVPYENSDALGHLRKDEYVPSSTHTAHLSFGMDDPSSYGYPRPPEPTYVAKPRSSRYDQNYERGSISLGGQRFCRYSRCGQPTYHTSGFCHAHVPNQLQMTHKLHQIKSYQLALCRGCHGRTAVSNVGLCDQCMAVAKASRSRYHPSMYTY